MNKFLLYSICLTFFCNMLKAQQTHTVGPKETLFSLGRDFNVHPRELAEYNHIDFEKGLTIGQVIKIPAAKKMKPVEAAAGQAATPVVTTTPKTENKATTAPKSDSKPAPVETPKAAAVEKPAATGAPIYHTVEKKENLFQIRMKYNRVPMDSLKKWNHLSSESVNEGMKLIVGYQNNGIASNNTVAKIETNTEAPKKAEAKNEAASQVIKVDSLGNLITSKETETPKSTVSEKPTMVDANKKNTESAPSKKEENTNTAATSSPATAVTSGEKKNFEGGFFRTQFKADNSNYTQNGLAAAFKSTSGWDDGRYYCLHNSAPAGTIVKVTNKSNQKVAYAKVLDIMPDLQANKDILIRISKAMAEELGISSDKAEVTVSF